MTKFSKSDVLKLARLARLKLTDEEAVQFTHEFSVILDYVDQLSDANTDGLKPTYQVNGLSTVTRGDEPIDYGADQASLLKNVPKVKDDHIVVKRMLK